MEPSLTNPAAPTTSSKSKAKKPAVRKTSAKKASSEKTETSKPKPVARKTAPKPGIRTVALELTKADTEVLQTALNRLRKHLDDEELTAIQDDDNELEEIFAKRKAPVEALLNRVEKAWGAPAVCSPIGKSYYCQNPN